MDDPFTTIAWPYLDRPDPDPLKAHARQCVNVAVRKGKLQRPERCEDCGNPGPVEGHHPDYAEPLRVDWLCSGCHGKRHRRGDKVMAKSVTVTDEVIVRIVEHEADLAGERTMAKCAARMIYESHVLRTERRREGFCEQEFKDAVAKLRAS
jgi:hypothetical protein